MKKGGLSKTNSNLTKQRSRATVTKQSTNATRGNFGIGNAFGHQSSFNLGTSQSSVSIAQSYRQGPGSRQENGRNSVRLTTHGAGTSSGLGPTPQKGKFTFQQQRPSNVTYADRSTAMHTGLPSPSLGMFKMASFNSGLGIPSRQGLAGKLQPPALQSGLGAAARPPPSKTRDQLKRSESEADHIQRKKGLTFDKAFSSHIDTLPGKHLSTKHTQIELEAQEQDRRNRKENDPAFKLRNQAFYGSYMLDSAKGRSVDVPREFGSYRKETLDGKCNRAPSNVSNEARNRLIYSSNFKIE